MSNFIKPTLHPTTGKLEIAEWLDDYFGRHQYGVRFSDGSVVHEDMVRATREDKVIDDLANRLVPGTAPRS